MADSNLTSITVIIDRSGSMEPLIGETVAGFNGFLETQKAAPGEALLTLVYFDTAVFTRDDGVALRTARPLTAASYWDRGGGSTALLDAFGITLEHARARIAAMPEAVRPGRVLFVVMTDGQENASTRYTSARVKSLVEEAKAMGWEFLFLGANIDAFAVGGGLGMDPDQVANYEATRAGTHAGWALLSERSSAFRSADAGAASSAVRFRRKPTTDPSEE
ncbi:MAG: vWA domain-containing protein [Deltaproteobacteria bacterium]